MRTRKGSSDELKEILELIDPETFLDYEGIDYKRTFGSSGTQLNIKTCPRCGGSEWKVYLSAETGLGNCFHGSCVGEAGYNIFSFAKNLWETDSRDTIQRLKDYAKEQGWIAKKTTSVSVDMSTIDVEMPDSVALPYKDKMPKYLLARGITPAIAKYFNVRFCYKGVYLYTDMDGKHRWQNYDKRIIIPIFNLDGELRTFQGRDILGESRKKYLFPPGLPGTARFLYNGQNVIGLSEIVMCEGAFDVWSVKMAMDEDVALRGVGQIGSFGKHLSYGAHNGEDQLGALATLRNRGLKRVVIMWDGEAEALRSAVDAGKHIRSIGLSCDIAMLPLDKDPNEVTGPEIRKAFYTAQSSNSLGVLREIHRRRSRKKSKSLSVLI